MFIRSPPLKLDNSDIFQLHTADNSNSSFWIPALHNLAPPKKLRIDSSFDESFAEDPQLNPSPIRSVPSQSPKWDTASGLKGFAASSFQIYSRYLPEFFPDMTDIPSSITETSQTESKPPPSPSSSSKPEPSSSSKPQPSSSSKPQPSSSSKPPPSSSSKHPPSSSSKPQPSSSSIVQQQASTIVQQQASFFRRPWEGYLGLPSYAKVILKTTPDI